MYDIDSTARIVIGRVRDDRVRAVQFDIRPWLQDMPEATFSMTFMRPGERTQYQPYLDTNREEGVLTWLVTAVDTGIPGTALAEIQAQDEDGAIRHSRAIACVINPSMAWAAGSEVPDALKDWAERLAQSQSQVYRTVEYAQNTMAALIETVNDALHVEKLRVEEDPDGYVKLTGGYTDAAYMPIGSYYATDTAASPASLFGGQWEEIERGTLYADTSREVGSTGGQETVVLIDQNLPKE